MKSRSNLLTIGICGTLFVLLLGYHTHLSAAGEDTGSIRIAVVSLREVFQNCRANQQYRTQAQAEQQKALDELNKLSDEIDAARAALKTRKQDSDDYWEIRQEILLKENKLEAQKEFYQQQLGRKDEQWTRQLYQQVVDTVAEVARARNIDLVFAKDESELPRDVAGTELMLLIRTHKLFYADDRLDISGPVLEALNGRTAEEQ